MPEDRRTAPRHVVLVRVTIQDDAGGKFDGTCLDIGPGGGYLACRYLPLVGAQVSITLWPPGMHAGAVRFDAEVRYLIAVAGTRPSGFGVTWLRASCTRGPEPLLHVLRTIVHVTDPAVVLSPQRVATVEMGTPTPPPTTPVRSTVRRHRIDSGQVVMLSAHTPRPLLPEALPGAIQRSEARLRPATARRPGSSDDVSATPRPGAVRFMPTMGVAPPAAPVPTPPPAAQPAPVVQAQPSPVAQPLLPAAAAQSPVPLPPPPTPQPSRDRDEDTHDAWSDTEGAEQRWPDAVPKSLQERYLPPRRIGRGANGLVYRSWDRLAEREVALKFMLPHASANQTARRYFLREYKMLAGLQHPNIVTIHDISVAEGTLYLAMEHVDGVPLSTFLADKRPVPLDFAVSVLTQLASALDHAHARGVLHRDVKPGNVMVTSQGHVKLVDFGLARLQQEGIQQSLIVGTPSYMAPEQQARGEIDHRADLYSLAVLAFRLLTGRLPYEGESVLDVYLGHATGAMPDPRDYNSTLPAAVAPVLRKAMAKKPEQRYENAGSFLADLTAALR